MTKKTTNRYALLSRTLLQDALLELLKEKSYPKISVTDIVARAELSRPTFYAHFETKDALLMSYVDDLLDEVHGIVMKNRQKSPQPTFVERPEMGIGIFAAWLERKAVFEQIRSADIDYLIFKKIRDHHHRLFSERLPANPLDTLNPILRDYCINYAAGSIAMLLIHWLDQGMPHPPEDMQRLMAALNARNFALVRTELNDVIV